MSIELTDKPTTITLPPLGLIGKTIAGVASDGPNFILILDDKSEIAFSADSYRVVKDV